ncbi:hypothetical protein P8452_32807 [Trifolium repens]|nr:hypothetical protein P8452_32807 [Trifolium repens]
MFISNSDDSFDSSYYGNDSSEDEAAGINFNVSDDDMALRLDNGFDVVLEPPPHPPPMVDVGGLKNDKNSCKKEHTKESQYD